VSAYPLKPASCFLDPQHWAFELACTGSFRPVTKPVLFPLILIPMYRRFRSRVENFIFFFSLFLVFTPALPSSSIIRKSPDHIASFNPFAMRLSFPRIVDSHVLSPPQKQSSYLPSLMDFLPIQRQHFGFSRSNHSHLQFSSRPSYVDSLCPYRISPPALVPTSPILDFPKWRPPLFIFFELSNRLSSGWDLVLPPHSSHQRQRKPFFSSLPRPNPFSFSEAHSKFGGVVKTLVENRL